MLNVYVLGTMASKPRHDELRAMQKRLRDEILGEKDASKTSGLVEELSIRPDPDTDRPQMRVATKLGQA